MQWYVSQNGKTTGPFSEERVAMLVNWGKISSDAYLCDDKWSCWVTLRRSPFAALLADSDADRSREAQVAPSEPPAESGWFGHRLALALLLMLTAAAFLLALWLAPGNVPGAPLGQAVRVGHSALARSADTSRHAGRAPVAACAPAVPAHPHACTTGLQPTTHGAARAQRA